MAPFLKTFQLIILGSYGFQDGIFPYVELRKDLESNRMK